MVPIADAAFMNLTVLIAQRHGTLRADSSAQRYRASMYIHNGFNAIARVTLDIF